MKRTPLRPRSKAKAKEIRTRAKLSPKLLHERGDRCQVRSPVCTGEAGCMHEVEKRSHQGSVTDPENLELSCTPCNGYIEDHPDWAIQHGFTKSPTPILHAMKMASIRGESMVDAFEAAL